MRFTPPRGVVASARPTRRSVEERLAHPRVLLGLVLLGVVLRVWQWAAGGSLWLDEISLARNILGLPLGALLTRPLAFDQVAPRGFLLIEKLVTMAFGGGERALWLFPLLCGLLGLVLYQRLAARLLRGAAAPIAVALFALGLALIRYSAETKQYGVDATAAVGLTLLALDLRERDRSTAGLLLAGVAGLLVIWFSQSAALVMTGLGAALALCWLLERDRRTLRALLGTVPLWAVAAVVAVVVGEHSMTPSTRAFMQDFWRGGFLPLPPRVSTAAPWLWERLTGLFGDGWTLRYPWPWAFALLALGGVAALWRQRRDAALLVAGPFAVTLVAAAAQQYPFRTRLVVFLVPGALLAAAAGAGWIVERAARRSTAAGLAVAGAALVPAVAALGAARMPVRVEDYPPLYARLRAERRPGDAVHVTFLAFNSAIFYGPRYGLRPGDYRLGACDRNDTRAYLRDVDRYRGRPRVWVITKDSPAYRPAHDAVRRYLSTIGVHRDSLVQHQVVSDPSRLDLYDLSDPARLRAASAETFPVQPMLAYPKPGCRDWRGSPRAVLGLR